jgi:multidrug efflux pump subunit AcrA (membrane-fusion protein)
MVKKNYQTASQAQAETSRRESYQLALNKVKLNLENLVKSQKLRDLNTFIGDLEDADRNLKRVIDHAESLAAQNRKDAAIKKSILEQEKAHYNDILKEIKQCKIYAPQDGMAVYYIPEQARFGGGSQQSIVAQGEPVREGQKLMQIPDLKHMLVNTKVHEALISYVHAGQPAMIKVDSFGGRMLHGHVESVATVAAQQDFFAADVKVYTTKVAIDADDIADLDLKPGMSAEVTIQIQKALENVLPVPVQAIVGGSEMGSERTIVVMTPNGPVQKAIKVGLFNEKMAEIKEGLEEGDEVVLNPKAVLGEKIKTREPGTPRSSSGGPQGPGDGGDGSKKGKGGNGGGKGKKPDAFKQ